MLQNLQADFAQAILSEDYTTESVQPTANMVIYQNNRRTNLLHTLEEIYPMVQQIVGAEFFRAIGLDYLENYPSGSSNLHDYGEYFADFLAHYPPTDTLPYLSEVALFEWTSHTLCFAAEHSGMDLETLKNTSPERYPGLRFALHPASRLLHFHYPLLRIIDLCNGVSDENVELAIEEVYLLIIRQELEINLLPLTESEFTFLCALRDEQSLSDAVELALEHEGEFNLEEKLIGWAQSKVLVECY